MLSGSVRPTTKFPFQGTSSCFRTRWERSAWLRREAHGSPKRQGGWRHRPGNYKAPLKTDRASFCTDQQALSVKSVLVYLLLFVKAQYTSLSLWLASKIIDVVLFPALVTSPVGTHISCCCLGVEHASSQFSRELTVSMREAVREVAPLPPGVLWGGRFGSRSPRGSLCCRGAKTTRISGFANESDSGGWDGLFHFSAFTCQI